MDPNAKAVDRWTVRAMKETMKEIVDYPKIVDYPIKEHFRRTRK